MAHDGPQAVSTVVQSVIVGDGKGGVVAQIASSAAAGAVTGGAHGAVWGGVKAFLRTTAGKVTVTVVSVILALVLFMVSSLISTMASMVASIPSRIATHATQQMQDFLSSGMSALFGADTDPATVETTIDDWVGNAGDAPWAALAALEMDAAQHGPTGGGSGPYGIDTGAIHRTGVDFAHWCVLPRDWDGVWADHAKASDLVGCLLGAAMTTADPGFTSDDILDGVEEYADENGDPGYRVDPTDLNGDHAQEVFTRMFALMPIPDATQRAPQLYDQMIRAALGIVQSCGSAPVVIGVTTPGAWTNPAQAPVTDVYGMRVNPVSGAYILHAGVDLGAPCGTPIHAAATGVVLRAGDTGGGFGGLTVIDHGGGVSSWYAHQKASEMRVRVGDRVTPGQIIGLVNTQGNSTGCHLHLEIHQTGARDLAGGDTIDPTPFFLARGVTLGQDQSLLPGGGGLGPDQSTGVFTATDGNGTVWTLDRGYQMVNARTIVDTGRRLGAPDTVIVAALGTAIIESRLSNLANRQVPESMEHTFDAIAAGDLDSIGVFQQRPSQGWGSVSDIMGSVEYQATQFYTRAIPAYAADTALTPGQVSVAVQRPAMSVEPRYTTITPVATALLHALAGTWTVTPVCAPAAGSYGPTGAGIVAAATDMGAWGGAYLWGGGHGSLGDLTQRMAHRFAGGRVVTVDETPPGDTNAGVTPNQWGVDCSGFVRAVIYQATGVDTGDWAVDPTLDGDDGHHFVLVSEDTAQPGDLFFTAGHTGVILSTDPATRTYQAMSARDVDMGMGTSTYTYGSAVRGVYRFIDTTDPHTT
ncbi:MAG: peptidoglycan DD-metalloendopeptidase family protein [Propionibacteriaceae bacterium]|nr:peptidoglycan DD-metalloendopeptidase family protein [Propionibacteriaceae bacterium]